MVDPRNVLARFLSANGQPSDELKHRIEMLLKRPARQDEWAAVAKWMDDALFFNSSKTPRGQKKLKEDLLWLHQFLDVADRNMVTAEMLESSKGELAQRWGRVEVNLAAVNLFSRVQGKATIPLEVTINGNSYRNLSGFSETQISKYAERLEQVFDEIKGWRRKALGGGIKVALAGPKEFRGTAAGTYKSQEDTLYVRATPAIMKRSGREYAGFEYIIVHELGHRYERKNHLPENFDRESWLTTRYSHTEGESFAELFACSNFNIHNAGASPEILERFEAVMSGH